MSITRYNYNHEDRTLLIHTLDDAGHETYLIEQVTIGNRRIESLVILDYADQTLPGLLPEGLRGCDLEWLYTTLFLLGLRAKTALALPVEVDWANPAGWLLEVESFELVLSQSQWLTGRLALQKMLGLGLFAHISQFGTLWQLGLNFESHPSAQGLTSLDWLSMV